MKFGIDEIARHCLQRVRPDFAAGVRPGDVLVAGPNFGIGSREQAAAALVRLGVAAVVAPSYNGLYFRNAFNVGLLLLTCPHAARLVEGERVSLDPDAGRIHRRDGEALALRAAAGLPAGHGAGRRPAQSTEGAAKGARPQAGQAPAMPPNPDEPELPSC